MPELNSPFGPHSRPILKVFQTGASFGLVGVVLIRAARLCADSVRADGGWTLGVRRR